MRAESSFVTRSGSIEPFTKEIIQQRWEVNVLSSAPLRRAEKGTEQLSQNSNRTPHAALHLAPDLSVLETRGIDEIGQSFWSSVSPLWLATFLRLVMPLLLLLTSSSCFRHALGVWLQACFEIIQSLVSSCWYQCCGPPGASGLG